MKNICVRKAELYDLVDIKRLSESERESVGFMTISTYRKAIESRNIFIITVDDKVVGFQMYNHRKRDLQTTLYQKIIDPQFRLNGFARMLFEAVVIEAKSIGHNRILLKCPVELDSNNFHAHMGFKLIGQEMGKRRKLNIWEKVL